MKRLAVFLAFLAVWSCGAAFAYTPSVPAIPPAIYIPPPPGLINIAAAPYKAKCDGITDDTNAIQAAMNAARTNAAIGGSGTGKQTGIFIPPGKCLVTHSLDYTSDGSVQSLVIRGAGILSSQLYFNTTDGPYPALDVTGVGQVDLEDFQMRGASTTQSSAALLISQDINAVANNYRPHLNHVWMDFNAFAPNYVGCLIHQNGDLGVVENSTIENCSTFVGKFLPVLRGATAQAGSSSTITLDSGSSASDSTYNGYSITIISGTGIGQTRAISSYVGSTKIATLATNWTIAPDSTSIFRIWSIKSKYRTIPATGDQTLINYVNSTFAGPVGIQGLQFQRLNLSGSYITTTPGNGGKGAAIYLQLVDPYVSNPIGISAVAMRTENQATNTAQFDVNTEVSSTYLNIVGSDLSYQQKTCDLVTGAHFSDSAGGNYGAINVTGADEGCATSQLLDQHTATNGMLMGQFRTTNPGLITGFSGMTFDWMNPVNDAAWMNSSTGFYGKVPWAFARAYLFLDNSSSGSFQNGQFLAGTYTANISSGGAINCATTGYTGGTGSQLAYSCTIAGGMMTTGTSKVRRTLHIHFSGQAAQTMTGFIAYLKQASTSTSATFNSSVTPAAGDNIDLEADIVATSSAGTAANMGGRLTYGSNNTALGATAGWIPNTFNPALPFTIEFWVSSASNNPLSALLFNRSVY